LIQAFSTPILTSSHASELAVRNSPELFQSLLLLLAQGFDLFVISDLLPGLGLIRPGLADIVPCLPLA
jgi:hypothetical protein